jgi:hypothetical protein
LNATGAKLDRTTFLDDDDIEVPIETLGFPKKIDGEEGSGRSTADDGNRVVVLQTS